MHTYSSLHLSNQLAKVYSIQSYKLNNLSSRKYLIVDIEATGLEYANEEITEIAAMPIEQQKANRKELRSYLLKINREIPKNIQEMTGITNKDVALGKGLKDVLGRLVEKYRDYVWVAQCGFEFDFPFLDKEHRRLFNEPLPVAVLDTKVLYANLNRVTAETISTDFLAEKYCIDRSLYTRHRAAGDVQLLSDIFLGVLEDYKIHGKDAIQIDEPIEVRKFLV